MRCLLRSVVFFAPFAFPLWSQHWEVGASAGYGLYRDVSVTNGAVTGKTGFQSGVAFGGVFGNETTRHVGGEVRYTYRANDLRVSAGGAKATAGAESHALHYDVLIHAASSDARARPFLAIGGGMKYYR